MYWGFGLLPEASKKWKVRPTASVLEMLKIQHSTGKGKAGFWLYCYYLIKYQQVQVIVKEF